ncbi:MAG: acetate--CoA ligase family protein [Desulfobaccales bacterium]|nr:acetate--CoA ligase family protein [Desulfobaccales bacterium]
MSVSISDLQAIFAPRSVAVIGATSRLGSVGRAVFANVLQHGYAGVVFPVNPKAASIMSVKAYPSVLTIPDEVDLAIIIIPSAGVTQVMEECGQKGIKAAIVITAGFKELGAAGAEKEKEVLLAAQRRGIRLLGPNCLGIINTDPQVSLNGSFARLMPLKGNIALISQSGAVGVAALEYAQGEKIGLSKFVSVGNKADLNENDFLAYLKDDPQTEVICFYLEDLTDPARFFQLAQEVTGETGPKKPILAIKSGRTPAGARAASSHTGALAGSDKAYDALFAQCGVLRVESLEELFDYAGAFALQPLPQGNRVAVVTNAGGLGIMTTDAAVRYGLTMAALTSATTAKLRAGLPAAANIHNPVDVLGDAGADRYETALTSVLGDSGVDGAIVISTPQLMTDLTAIAAAVSRVAAGYAKPILVCQMALEDIDKPLAILTQAGLPHYRFPEEAARALGAMARYALNLRRPGYEIKTFAGVDKDRVKSLLAGAREQGRHLLLEPEAHEVFRAYGFPVVPGKWANSEDEAVQAAAALGYPVVLKIVSPEIIHKFDVGGVRLNLASEEEVRRAFKEMLAAVHASHPTAHLEGVLVQQMAPKGRETILGMSRDPHFGPLIMFGLGGTYVEIFKDVIFRVAPISELWAHRMIQELKGFQILTGYRGEPRGDLEAIADCLERLSQLVLDFPEIQELDINPLMVFEQGKGAAVLDARIFIG